MSDISFFFSMVTAIGVFALVWQVVELRRQSSIAYNPLMSVRFETINEIPCVRVENVGHGTAVNVDLEILDADNHELIRPFTAFALQKGGGRTTDISFRDHPRILMRGTYRNVRRGLITERDVLFDFEELERGL